MNVNMDTLETGNSVMETWPRLLPPLPISLCSTQ